MRGGRSSLFSLCTRVLVLGKNSHDCYSAHQTLGRQRENTLSFVLSFISAAAVAFGKPLSSNRKPSCFLYFSPPPALPHPDSSRFAYHPTLLHRSSNDEEKNVSPETAVPAKGKDTEEPTTIEQTAPTEVCIPVAVSIPIQLGAIIFVLGTPQPVLDYSDFVCPKGKNIAPTSTKK